jgi:hypothetical protein
MLRLPFCHSQGGLDSDLSQQQGLPSCWRSCLLGGLSRIESPLVVGPPRGSRCFQQT